MHWNLTSLPITGQEIGEPQREIVTEPLETPRTLPAPPAEPARPIETPQKEPVPVPA